MNILKNWNLLNYCCILVVVLNILAVCLYEKSQINIFFLLFLFKAKLLYIYNVTVMLLINNYLIHQNSSESFSPPSAMMFTKPYQ